MPWTGKQMHSIQARAHGWKGPGAFLSVGTGKAKQMAAEGVSPGPQGRAARLRSAFQKMGSMQ